MSLTSIAMQVSKGSQNQEYRNRQSQSQGPLYNQVIYSRVE